VLQALERRGVLSTRELTDQVFEDLALAEADRRQTIPSGASLIANRVHWAVTYLNKAKAVERPKRGHVEITQRGRDLLAAGGEIRNSSLDQFPEYREFAEKWLL
jgi:restriction system protein